MSEATPNPEATPSRRPLAIALGVLLVMAFLLRLPGITYGLPWAYAPDETSKIETVMRFSQGEFFHAAHQPSFMFNTLFLWFHAMEPFRGLLLASVELPPGTTAPQADFAFHLLAGRLWMVVLSVATVAAVFVLGRRVAGTAAGLTGALVFAVLPLSISLSHYIKEDTPLGLWTTIALIAALRVQERGRWQDYAVAGLCCGATFGAKYPGGLTLVAVLVAHFTQAAELRADRGRHARTGLLVPAFAAGFFVTSPAIFVHLGSVLAGVGRQVQYMQGGHHDSIAVEPMEHAFAFYLTKALIPTMTIPPVLAGIAGLAILVRYNRGPGIVLASWTVGYYLLAEAMPAKPYPFFARYMMAIVPMLCVGAGIFAVESARRARYGATGAQLGALAVAAMVFGGPFLITAFFVRNVTPDTRDRAAQWLREHPAAQSGGTILVPNLTMLRYYTPRLDGTRWQAVEMMPDAIASAEAADSESSPTLAIMSSATVDRYFENPTDVPETTAMLLGVAERWRVAMRFENAAGRQGFHNPTLVVFAVPAAGS